MVEEEGSFSFSVRNNLEVVSGMPLHVDPCDKCHRTTLRDDVDVQIVGYHWEYSYEGEGYEPIKYKEPNWMCKDCRKKYNKTAKSDFKKEDIGKRKVYVKPTLKEVEFYNNG